MAIPERPKPLASEHELDVGQYIAVSDLMAMVSQLSRVPPSSHSRIAPSPSQKFPSALPPASSPNFSNSNSSNSNSSNSNSSNPPLLRETPPSPDQLANKTVEELAQELWELKLVTLSDSDYYNRQLVKLKRRLLWLMGMSVGAIAGLGIALGWTTATLRTQDQQITRYENAVQLNKTRIERLEGPMIAKMERELKTLQNQVPDSLEKDLTATQEELKVVKEELMAMEEDLATQDKMLSVVMNLLQGKVNDN